jgi:hypothetical protein
MDLPCADGLLPADLLARADALRDARAWADAAEFYAGYLRRNPSHWQIWVQYGHCTKECGDIGTALLLYQERRSGCGQRRPTSICISAMR